MTAIERAARALYAITPQTIDVFTRDCANPKAGVSRETRPMPWDDLDEEARAPFVNSARAVLEAIREPSEGMVKEGAYQIPCGQGVEEGPPNASDAKDCWQAMIDAALSEKPE